MTLLSQPWSNAHSQIAFGETYIHEMRWVSQATVIMVISFKKILSTNMQMKQGAQNKEK